ncbi:MAG TPA: biotin/lipoyl-containing protein [Nitrososphaerales archaeon]|nr:biotin/lipoyl-containing protein [Nitrososphaerales archaeon]
MVEAVRTSDGFLVTVGKNTYSLKLKRGVAQNEIVAEVSDKPVTVALLEANSQKVEISLNGERFSFQRPAAAIEFSQSEAPVAAVKKDVVVAPMPGRVIGILVKAGEKVRAGDPLVIIESMKMEIAVRSDRDGEVEEALVSDGTTVKRGQALVKLRS